MYAKVMETNMTIITLVLKVNFHGIKNLSNFIRDANNFGLNCVYVNIHSHAQV